MGLRPVFSCFGDSWQPPRQLGEHDCSHFYCLEASGHRHRVRRRIRETRQHGSQRSAARREVAGGLLLRNVYAEAFENHRGEKANQQILRLLDTDHDGALTASEKQSARIIIYGHSWGASEALALARELKQEGIPVLLTIQIDSVSKHGQNDRFVPANVGEAVNFYQSRGLDSEPDTRFEPSTPRERGLLGIFMSTTRAIPSSAKGIRGGTATSQNLTPKLNATRTCGVR